MTIPLKNLSPPEMPTEYPDIRDVQRTGFDPSSHLVEISFLKIGKPYTFDFRDYPDLAIDDRVIVETNLLGEQMGTVKKFVERESLNPRENIYRIMRLASPADLLLQQQWSEKDVNALIVCRERASKAREYAEVKFVAAEYNYKGSTLTYYFTTELMRRINTHRLRNALQRQFNTRVEFRQIGPREVAKLQGGFGACGIPRCCSTFLTDFSTVTVHMAREQGITLSPSEILGVCGRLRCCLSYEYEQYVEARKRLPPLQSRVGTEHGPGRIVEIHAMKDAVSVLVNDEIHLVQREDITPLKEWEALRAAAASPCGKHEGGGCDCGSKRPRGDADELMAEMGVPAGGEVPHDVTPIESEENRKSRNRRGRRNRKRGGSQRGEGRNKEAKSETSSAEGRKKGSSRRNKNKKRGQNQDQNREGQSKKRRGRRGKRRSNQPPKNEGDGGNQNSE